MATRGETFTLTFGEQAENHAGMQIIGGGLAKEGFNLQDMEETKTKFENVGKLVQLVALHPHSFVDNTEDAYILIIRDGLEILLNGNSADKLVEEQTKLDWDKKALMRGKVVNKIARHNLCYGEEYQKSDISSGKGTIVPYSEIPLTKTLLDNIPEYFGEKARKMKAEGNRYYDIKNCGVGFHGDSERKIVIGVRLGEPMPFEYQWFLKSEAVGRRIKTIMNHGDVYMMSEKASGWDWKKRSIPTLRHAAGSEKYLTIIPRLTKLIKQKNKENIISKLLIENCNPNDDGGDINNLPIVEAVKRGNLSVIELLINEGAVYDLTPYGLDLKSIHDSKCKIMYKCPICSYLTCLLSVSPK